MANVDNQILQRQAELRQAKAMARQEEEERENETQDEGGDNFRRVKFLAKKAIERKAAIASAAQKAEEIKKVVKYLKKARMAWIIIGSSTFLFWFFVVLAGLALIVMIVSWMGEANAFAKGWIAIKGIFDVGWSGISALIKLFSP